MAKFLKNNEIIVAVEKTADIQNNVIDAANLQFIINGLAYENKLDVHFDYGKEKNQKILNDPIKQKKFIWKIKSYWRNYNN